eukprot:gene31429-6605_t
MAHLLRRFGAKALKQRYVDGYILPPMLSSGDAMKLREQFYRDGQMVLQYERSKSRSNFEGLVYRIQGSFHLCLYSYALRRLDWTEITPLDKLTLSPRQIREKYVKRK